MWEPICITLSTLFSCMASPLSNGAAVACLNFAAAAHAHANSIPDQYIWPESLRSARLHGDSSQNEPQIPVIDLVHLQGEGRHAIVQEIGHACREWGFFQIVNHGVSLDLMKEALEVALGFFTLGIEEKVKYSAADINSQFISYGTSFNPAVDTVLSWREFLRHHSNPIEQFIDLWPNTPTSYRKVMSGYCEEVQLLALRLLPAISESLGVDPNFLARSFDHPNSTQIQVLNHYPPCANPDVALGFAAHSDATGITILLQQEDVCGLQIKHKGEWVDAKPLKGALVINMGDQMEVLTNGQYKSVEHRALVNSSRTRISIATACGPSLQSVIGPAREFLGENEAPKYKATKFVDYLRELYAMGVHGKAMMESRMIV